MWNEKLSVLPSLISNIPNITSSFEEEEQGSAWENNYEKMTIVFLLRILRKTLKCQEKDETLRKKLKWEDAVFLRSPNTDNHIELMS